MEFVLLTLSGATIGLIVGVTGVGGGALMTPLLLLFGYPIHIAIGTDLLFAAITKSSGMVSHTRMGHVEWPVVSFLAIGSLPAALFTGLMLSSLNLVEQNQHIMTIALGVMLIATALVIFIRSRLPVIYFAPQPFAPGKRVSTVAVGAVLGFLVTLTSVGAGAVGTTILIFLFPWLNGRQVVGTDIAHAVPLTLVAGLVHLKMGQVDLSLLFALLLGSVPAIYLGAKLTRAVPQNVMMPILASLLFTLGMRYAFF